MRLAEKIKEKVLDVLFPRWCVECKKEGAYLCEQCHVFVSESAFICPVCEKQSFLGETHAQCVSRYGLDGFVSFWEYEGVIRELIHAIKYQGTHDAVRELAEKGKELMESDLHRFRSFLEFVAREDTAISFVPMHRSKERRRGFNQAQFIAQELGTVFSKTAHSFLEKIKDTLSQTDLTREQRLQNIRGSFAYSTWLRNQITQVVLVDDVWTTGATMRECCRILKKAGVEKVWGFTLARTV